MNETPNDSDGLTVREIAELERFAKEKRKQGTPKAEEADV